MKILIANYEYPPLGGGAGVCTKYHAEGLAALGHRVSVLTAWFKGEPEYRESGNLKIYRIKSKRKYSHKSNPLEMLSWANKSKKFFCRQLSTEAFEVCLTNFAIPGGWVGAFLKRKFGIPYIVISHGQDVPWFFPRQLLLYHAMFYFSICSLMRGSVKNILLTNDMKRQADQLLPKKLAMKNLVIPNGCDIAKFRPDYPARTAGFSILFTGRLRHQKDPMTFLRALKIVAGKQIPFQALILGDGPMRKQMEAFIRHHQLSERVTLTGWVGKDRMLSAYQSHSLLVSTSRDEGMSVALLEAISAGLFVLATPASGNREMVEEGVNGKIIPFGKPEHLALEIETFYLSKFLAQSKVPDESLEMFRARYSWDRVVAAYDKMLTEALA